MKRAKEIGNGYYKRRADSIIQVVEAIEEDKHIVFRNPKDKIFKEIEPFKECTDKRISDHPFTPQFVRKYTFSPATSEELRKYIDGSQTAGVTLEGILKQNDIADGDRKAISQLVKLCVSYDDRNGLVAVLRNDDLKGYSSEVRKKMFLIDLYIIMETLLVSLKQPEYLAQLSHMKTEIVCPIWKFSLCFLRCNPLMGFRSGLQQQGR